MEKVNGLGGIQTEEHFISLQTGKKQSVVSMPQFGTQICIIDLLRVVSHNALCTSHHFPCVLCVHALLTFTCIYCTHLHFGLDAHAHESRAVRCGAPRLMCAVLGLRIYRIFFTLFQYLFLV